LAGNAGGTDALTTYGESLDSSGGIMPSDVRFAELLRLVERHGWVLVRINGSHHIFKLPDGRIYVVPVHRNMVKYAYVREIKKLLGED
jgi:predicted RNA binding protein YcfA (HicA-like mRNA interferase family)